MRQAPHPHLAASSRHGALEATAQGLWDRSRITTSETSIDALALVLREFATGSDSAALTWGEDRYWYSSGSPFQRAQFFAIGNAINFRFWHISDDGMSPSGGILDGEFLVGSTYMWRRLRLILERGEFPLLDARLLAGLERDQLRSLLADDEAREPMAPGLDDRLENLRDLGRTLEVRWGGQFSNLISKAGEDLDEFYALSSELRAYDDPLRKLSSINAIMLRGSGLVQFRQSIPPAIDYHVAKQLLRMGVVGVDEATADDLRNQRLLPPGVGMSIRAACLAALEMVCQRADLDGDVVDNVLWSNRVVCTEPVPQCERCPLSGACEQRISIQRPLELTRFY